MTTQTLLIDDRPTAQLSLGLPEDEAPVAPASVDLDLVDAALAYLGQIGREPAPQPRWTAGDRRYLAGPLIVGDPQGAWGDDTPAWLRDAVRIARLGLVLAGEHDHASEEEAVAYLMAASLAAPLHHDWAALYFWVAARVLTRWSKVGQEEDFLRSIASPDDRCGCAPTHPATRSGGRSAPLTPRHSPRCGTPRQAITQSTGNHSHIE